MRSSVKVSKQFLISMTLKALDSVRDGTGGSSPAWMSPGRPYRKDICSVSGSANRELEEKGEATSPEVTQKRCNDQQRPF